MSVLRALTACPSCNKQEEVWFYNGLVKPFNILSCTSCSQIYEADSFISTLLDFKSNCSVSAKIM